MGFERGSLNRSAKLTQDDVSNIKKLYLSGKSQYAIAAMYRVAQSAISKIIKGQRWAHTDSIAEELKTRRPSDIERFHASYAIHENGCWIWQRSVFRPPHLPYGQFKALRNGILKNGSAHRWIYQHINGPLPENIFVCHTCDNPSCVNPDHLYAGTPKQNSHDRDSRGRGGALKGETNPAAKLTESDVIHMRRLFDSGVAVNEISKSTGVKHQHVSKIVRRQRWRHVA